MEPDRPSHRARLAEIARRAMVDRGLAPDFPDEVLAEAERLAPARPANSRDLRDLLWISIDNDDSRDLDQLTVAAPGGGEAVRVLVAVADVDALVTEGRPIDRHAQRNTTSVYTPARVFPMLPERLSTDLTSLNDGEDRLALVVDMEVDASGSVAGSELYVALVHNHGRLTYNAVTAWLENGGHGSARADVYQQLVLQERAARALRSQRQVRGALEIDTLEARPVFSGDSVAELAAERRNAAKDLIQDFMLAANGAIAGFLDRSGFPSLRRVVRTPKRWDRIVALAAAEGERLSAEPDPQALAAFLTRRRAADPEDFAELSTSIVKLLGSGEYAVDVPGRDAPAHFGLAVKNYTHATAPNRRYPDLVAHRLVKAALGGIGAPYTEEELAALARHCTLQEDAAAKVERQMRKAAAALLLAGRVGESFDAVVTGASEKGTWVRLLRPPVEGRLERGAAGLDVGDRLRVRLLGTDVDKGFIDFARD